MNTKINTVIEALEQAQKCVYSRSGFLAQEYINDALALLRSLPEQGEGPTDTELMNIAVSEAEVAHPSTDRRNYSGPRADEWYEEERDRIADRRKLHASVLFEERRRVRDSYAFNAGRLSAGHQQGEPVAWMRIRQGPAPDKGARGLFFTREEAEKWWSGTHDTIIPLYAHPPQVGPEEEKGNDGDAAQKQRPALSAVSPQPSASEDAAAIAIANAKLPWCLWDPNGGGVSVVGPFPDGTYGDPGKPYGSYTKRVQFRVVNGEIHVQP